MSAESPPHIQTLPKETTLPAIATLYISMKTAYILSDEGELQTLTLEQARTELRNKPVLLCHAPSARTRLGLEEFYAFDVLELYAFTHPTRFTVPTPHGLCKALNIEAESAPEDIPMSILHITKTLLEDLQNDPLKAKANPIEIAKFMGISASKNKKAQQSNWPWTPFILSALGEQYDPAHPIKGKAALAIWKTLPEWAEDAPTPPASHHNVSADETQERLEKLLDFNAEIREEQKEYAAKVTHAFEAIQEDEDPKIILAEAGTGIGKTLGYLASASVWSEKNQGTVWISTYTKNLQRQIDQELDRLYPNPELKDRYVATRKGRENYLCLLNLEDAISSAALSNNTRAAITAGLMTRWSAACKDGDLTGAQFPGWISSLLGYHETRGLADRRGECLYAACDHYRKCFIEHSLRSAEQARIVIANHALVMISAAHAAPNDKMPSRYIFDEGHHLFDAADSAFSSHLSARETRDFRRWVLGPEGGRRQSRARGLKRRAEDLAEGTKDSEDALQKIVHAAQCLPLDGWTRRLKDTNPSGPCETFLHNIYAQIQARAEGVNGPYSLETDLHPLSPSVLESAQQLKKDLKSLQRPMQALSKIFHKKLSDDDGALDSDTRRRLDSMSLSLERRANFMLQSWISMLDDLETGTLSPDFVDWIEIERIDGRAIDVGLYRHAIDPMKQFANSMRPHLQGMLITSATLKDKTHQDKNTESNQEDWDKPLMRSGAKYLAQNTLNVTYNSPFDYKNRTKIFILNDVNKNDIEQIAGAYRALFTASNGSALGLFTAISRLRAVQERIAPALEKRNIPLYAQHIDEIDTGTLIDMFRDDTRSCLLGTDAIRDGVDIPGESLRLIAFDRTPWPRPTLLHKARRTAFGGRTYDEMLTRLKLKQAFGRLIRSHTDKGVFVMIDSMLPSRLHNAFPDDVDIIKTGLSEACKSISTFLAE